MGKRKSDHSKAGKNKKIFIEKSTVDLESLIQTPVFFLFLNGNDLYKISSVAKKYYQFIFKDTKFDNIIWKERCRNDFHYVNGQAELCYRQKWKGFYLWQIEPKGWYEDYVQPNSREGMPSLELLNEFGTGVFIDDLPIAPFKDMVGSRWDGSLLRYIEYFNPPPDKFKEILDQLRSILNEGALSATEFLQDQIGSFLQFLAKGSYKVAIHDSNSTLLDWVQYHEQEAIEGARTVLIYTQLMDEENRNEERIEHYKEIINEGQRPIVLSAEIRGDLYVLDGHHKLHAYNELGIKPFIIVISREQYTPYTYLTEKSPWSSWHQFVSLDPNENFTDTEGHLSNKEKKMFGGETPEYIEEFLVDYIYRAKIRRNYKKEIITQSDKVKFYELENAYKKGFCYIVEDKNIFNDTRGRGRGRGGGRGRGERGRGGCW